VVSEATGKGDAEAAAHAKAHAKMKALRDNLLAAVRSLLDVSKVLAGPEDSRIPALTAAAALSDTIIKIIGLIQPAVEALTALANYLPCSLHAPQLCQSIPVRVISLRRWVHRWSASLVRRIQTFLPLVDLVMSNC
jgi:hypothetical protein